MGPCPLDFHSYVRLSIFSLGGPTTLFGPGRSSKIKWTCLIIVIRVRETKSVQTNLGAINRVICSPAGWFFTTEGLELVRRDF